MTGAWVSYSLFGLYLVSLKPNPHLHQFHGESGAPLSSKRPLAGGG